MKVWYWYVIAVVLLFVFGYTVRGYIDESHIKPGVVVTNTVNGNHPAYYTNINNTNQEAIFNAYVRMETEPFIFVQKMDTMTAYLDNRYGSTKIKQWYEYSGWMFGGGAEYYNTRLEPAALLGYHWEHFAVLGTCAISTNFNAAAFAVWMP